MIINFTHKHQFTTRLQLDNKYIEVVDHMKILGASTKDIIQFRPTDFRAKKTGVIIKVCK